MRRSLHRWHPVAPPPVGLVAPVRLDPQGVAGPTKRQATGRTWLWSSHGFYVPADAPRHLPEQLILEQAVRLPEHGAVTGPAACRLWGAAFFDGVASDGRTPVPVHLNVGPHGHLVSSRGSQAVHHTLLPSDRAWRFGIATVVAERAAYDAIRFTPDPKQRVVVADMVAAAEITSFQLVRAYAAAQPQHAWLVLAALDRASEHSRSPKETELRLIAEDEAGLPTLMVNPTIYRSDGSRVGEVDLLDPVAGMTLELDGADHRSATGQANDLERTRALEALGLVECRVVGFETAYPRRVVRRIEATRARARFLSPDRRAWYAVPRPDDLHHRVLEARAARQRGA